MLKPEFTGQFKRDYKLAVNGVAIRRNWKKSLRCYAMSNRCRRRIEITLSLIPETIRI